MTINAYFIENNEVKQRNRNKTNTISTEEGRSIFIKWIKENSEKFHTLNNKEIHRDFWSYVRRNNLTINFPTEYPKVDQVLYQRQVYFGTKGPNRKTTFAKPKETSQLRLDIRIEAKVITWADSNVDEIQSMSLDSSYKMVSSIIGERAPNFTPSHYETVLNKLEIKPLVGRRRDNFQKNTRRIHELEKQVANLTEEVINSRKEIELLKADIYSKDRLL